MMTLARKTREAFFEARSEREGELPCQLPTVDPDDWFGEPGSQRSVDAQVRCMGCPIVNQCAAYAIENGVPDGVWGGVNERDRRHIWGNRPSGRPQDFTQEMDAATLPLLQERRDFESFDRDNAQTDAERAMDWAEEWEHDYPDVTEDVA